MNACATEIRAGQRFGFGQNWQRLLKVIDNDRIMAAEHALCHMLEVHDLKGMSFLDIGSGSGLSSLVAMRLGAVRVHSFDLDPQSVACTKELRQRYFPEATNWVVEEGSVLDSHLLSRLGTFDIVYSWGVLHHTGNMWQALEDAGRLVADAGKLFIAIYNDEGEISRLWTRLKIFYNRGTIWRPIMFASYFTWQMLRGLAVDVVVRRRHPLARYREYKKLRGMSFARDLSDWLGGYPFEVAKPESILEFFLKKHFKLVRLRTVSRGHGNNEYVFQKCME
jgi:2-polyprenyl-6-hydroxyphenyl methylase/3-demethylubiquinone-9 3-methyltransferase